jgi:hypothetical protein
VEKLLKTKKDREQFITWLAWLKSGAFTQSIMWLQNAKGHCCLGVACELFIPLNKLVTGSADYIIGGVPSDDQYNAPQWLKGINKHFLNLKGYAITQLNDGMEVDTSMPWYESVMRDFGTSKVKLNFSEIADVLYETYKDEL